MSPIQLFRPEKVPSSFDAFTGRLSNSHPLYHQFQTQRQNQAAGNDGEQRLLRFLIEALHDRPSYILHNYHTTFASRASIQIDFVILTKTYILLLEVKNIKGHITFQQNPNQMIRLLDGQPQAMDCPLEQLSRNQHHFKKLVGNSDIPIYTAVIWANRSTIFTPLTTTSLHPILFLKQLPVFINTLDQLELPTHSVKPILKRLQSNATPLWRNNLCAFYGVMPVELSKGIQCLTCFTPMRLHAKSWVCPVCKIKNNHMLEANIITLFDILGDELKMRDLQMVLPYLKARNLTNLINAGSISHTFQKKNRVYTLNRSTKIKWIEVVR